MTDEPRFQRVEGGADTLHLRYHGGGVVAVVLWLADLWISARGGTPAHRSASIAAAAQTSVRRARAWALVSAVLMVGIVALITVRAGHHGVRAGSGPLPPHAKAAVCPT